MKDERLTSICFLCWFACGWIGKPKKERLSFIIAGPDSLPFASFVGLHVVGLGSQKRSGCLL